VFLWPPRTPCCPLPSVNRQMIKKQFVSFHSFPEVVDTMRSFSFFGGQRDVQVRAFFDPHRRIFPEGLPPGLGLSPLLSRGPEFLSLKTGPEFFQFPFLFSQGPDPQGRLFPPFLHLFSDGRPLLGTPRWGSLPTGSPPPPFLVFPFFRPRADETLSFLVGAGAPGTIDLFFRSRRARACNSFFVL